MRTALVVALSLCLVSAVSPAQTTYTYATGQRPFAGLNQWQVLNTAVPQTVTVVTGTGPGGAAVYLESIVCNTSTATAATITLSDAVSGTPIWTNIAIAGNTAYSFNFLGESVPGGVKWSSTGGTVYCWLQGGY